MSNQYGNYQASLGTPPAYPAPLIGFILYVAGNPTALGTVAMPGALVIDTVGNQLYRTPDGTTWVAVA